MKKILLASVLLASFMISAKEFVKNRDFAEGTKNWRVMKLKKDVTYVTPQFLKDKDGKSFIRFAKKTVKMQGNVYQNINLPAGEYVISYEVKAEPKARNVSYVYVYGTVNVNDKAKRKGVNFGSALDLGKHKANTSWVKVTRKIVIPENAKTSLVHVVAHPGYAGNVDIRNVSITGK